MFALSYSEFLFNTSEQVPVFEKMMYAVPENNLSVPLCIDVGAIDSMDQTFTITARQKTPPKAEGR